MAGLSKTTEKAIRENFPGGNNKALRAEIREAASRGRWAVSGIAGHVALTVWGKAGLEAVCETLPSDYREATPEEADALANDPGRYGQDD